MSIEETRLLTSVFKEAETYLRAPVKSFWEWVDAGEAVRWREGPTIVIRAELAQLLNALSAYGLPPLEMVLLVLAACRDPWRESSEDFSERLTQAHPHFTRRGGGQIWLQEAVRTLERVNSLPETFRKSTEGRTVLCESLFETFPNRKSWDVSREVVQLLQGDRLPERVLTQPSDLPLISETTRNLMALCDAITRIDAGALALRKTTGLDQRVEAIPDRVEEAEEEPSARLTIRQLLALMERDPELAGLAKLTRNLQAIVHLPRQIQEPDEMPLGGLSDIAHRGRFERLLLSELANDSDTLMTRVALGEALYLRRERPPSHPPRRRVVLLDSGIRMWGLPRVFASAVALSLAAEVEGRDATFLFRAEGDVPAPIDASTTEGLIEHLAILDPHAHPGNSLPTLLEQVGADVDDLVIISCAEAFGDPQFRQRLREAGLPRCYLASVARDGSFQLVVHSPHGEKTLKTATFNLGGLLAPSPRPATPLIDPAQTLSLPAILRLDRFPLRLAHPTDHATLWSPHGGEVLALTSDRRLMKWTSADLGAIQITDRLPGTRVLWRGLVGPIGDEQFAFVVEHARDGKCSLVLEMLEAEVQIAPLSLSTKGLQGFSSEREYLVVIYRDRAQWIDAYNGEVFAESKLQQHLHWRHGQYFRGEGGWFRLCLQGGQPVAELVLHTKRPQDYDIVFFSWAAAEHVAVTTAGELVVLGRKERRKPIPLTQREFITVREVSSDGNWMQVEWRALTGFKALSGFKIPTLEEVPQYAFHPLHMVKQTNIRTQITSIGVVDGQLSLITNRGRRLELTRVVTLNRLVLKLVEAEATDDAGHYPVVKARAPDGVGYQLRVCEWPDGSRAYVDSRGLLHLMSSDPSIPEATFVLADRHVSGWMSNGKLFGAPFYTGATSQTEKLADPSEVESTVLKPFARQIEDTVHVQRRR